MSDRGGLVLGAVFAFCAFMLADFAVAGFGMPARLRASAGIGCMAVFAVLAGIGVCFLRHFLLVAFGRGERGQAPSPVVRAERGEPAVTGQAPRSVTDEGA